MVNIKWFFYGLILLSFDNTNKVMQNFLQKFRRRSIVLEKPGFLFESLKNVTSSNYRRIQYETSHTFLAYQCLQKWDRDFSYFV